MSGPTNRAPNPASQGTDREKTSDALQLPRNDQDVFHGFNLLALQQSAGNSATAQLLDGEPSSPSAQSSELSNSLRRTYNEEGSSAFFTKLLSVRECDPDLEKFIESLPGDEQEVADSIMGEIRNFNTEERLSVLIQLGDRLGSAKIDFSDGAQLVAKDISDEAKARADFINLLVQVPFSLFVPSVAAGLTGLLNQLPISASTNAYKVALAVQGQAKNIAQAAAPLAKSAASSAVASATAGNSPAAFFSTLKEAFQAGTDALLGDIRSRISSMPDYELLLHLANWDPLQRTDLVYAAKIRKVWDTYESEVLQIGDFSASVENVMTEITSTRTKRLVELDGVGETQLAIVEEYDRAGPLKVRKMWTWVRAVSPEHREMAKQRAKQVQGVVPKLDPSEVTGVPPEYR